MSDSFRIDFVGIGASKSGTTWLGHMLDQHPQLCMSVPKEVHFFNDKLRYRNRIMERNYNKGLSWYQKHFNHCSPGAIKGEITPRYCNDPVVPGRIKKHNPQVKIFYCLRSPVDRISSHYNFAKYFVGIEDRTFDQAVREEPEFIEMSLYFRNLSMFLEHFPREQIFIVWFEDIKERPDALLKDIYGFLGVDTGFLPSNFTEKSNHGRISRFTLLQDFIRKFNRRLIDMGFSGWVRKVKKAGLGRWVMKLNSKPLQKEKMSPALKTYIIEQVREDVLQLQQWSGRDLSHWLN